MAHSKDAVVEYLVSLAPQEVKELVRRAGRCRGELVDEDLRAYCRRWMPVSATFSRKIMLWRMSRLQQGAAKPALV